MRFLQIELDIGDSVTFNLSGVEKRGEVLTLGPKTTVVLLTSGTPAEIPYGDFSMIGKIPVKIRFPVQGKVFDVA
jgi:hypothetical protein